MRWRTLLRVLLMVLAIVGLCIVLPWGWRASRAGGQAAISALTAWRDAQPAPELPVRPGDRERYPRHGFGLVLESGRGFRVDTFAGTATKDMIGLPDTTIALSLSDAQLDTLYEAAIRIRFFDYPERYSPPGLGGGAFPTAGSIRRLSIRAGGATKRIAWNTDEVWSRPLPDEWKRLDSLLRMLGRMVREHPAYRALPPPRGGYI